MPIGCQIQEAWSGGEALVAAGLVHDVAMDIRGNRVGQTLQGQSVAGLRQEDRAWSEEMAPIVDYKAAGAPFPHHHYIVAPPANGKDPRAPNGVRCLPQEGATGQS